tara:strand:+ start:942 stop:2627 length:1686 start_codon:yes stop_codon:yes gene_type:complete
MKENYIKQSPMLTLPSLGGGVGNKLHGGVPESDPWGLSFGPNYNDVTGSNIRLDNQRNIIVVSGEIYTTKVTKFKNDGTFLWAKSIRGPNNYGSKAQVKHQGLATDSAGNIFISDAIGYNYPSHDGIRENDLYLIKLDPNGAILWQKGILTTSQGQSNAWGSERGGITTDPAGNVYITGGCWSGSSYYKQMFVMKFDPSGNVVWQKRINQGNNHSYNGYGRCMLYVPHRAAHTDAYGQSIAEQSEGVLIYGDINISGYWNQNVFLTKFDVNGNWDWYHVYGHYQHSLATNESEGTSQLLTQNPTTGDIYISGQMGGWNSHQTWASRVRPDGQYSSSGQWSWLFGHTGFVPSAITYDPTNNYVIGCGYRWSYGWPGDTTGWYTIRTASNGGLIGKGYLNTSAAGAFHSSYPSGQKNIMLNSVVTDDKGHWYLQGDVQNFTAPNSNRNVVLLKMLAQQNWPYTTNQSYIGYNLSNWVGTGWSLPGQSSYFHNAKWGLSNGMYSGYPNNEPPDTNFWSFASSDLTNSNNIAVASLNLTVITTQYTSQNQGSYNHYQLYDPWPTT